MGRMIIGVDPHKASVTIEVVDEDGAVAARGRFATDARSYRSLLGYVRRWPHRVWAVEGAGGAGRPLAQRLVADGERVLDVPAKLAARVRVFDTGQGRKTDAVDAHSIAAVALRPPGLRLLRAEDAELPVVRRRTSPHCRPEPSWSTSALATEPALCAGSWPRSRSANWRRWTAS